MDLAVLGDMGAELQEVRLSYFQHPSILTVHLFWGSLLKAMTIPVSILRKSTVSKNKQTNKTKKTFALRQALDVLNGERLARCKRLSWAEVNDLQVLTVIHQHVVRLQVQVDHPTAVEVVDGTQDLEQQLGNLRLCVQISEESKGVWSEHKFKK